jgi:ATP-dependent helicase/nuclease subunit B
MRLAHAASAQARGLKVWRTPQILPWSTWLRRQYLEARASASGISSLKRVLTPAQSRALWDEVVVESRFGRDLLNPANAARLAARSWRQLHDYLIPLDSLAAYETPESMALETWCTEFSRRCAALNALDEAELVQWAEDVKLVPTDNVACAGFDAMAPAMRRLIDRWRVAGRLVDLEARPKRATDIAIIGAEDAAQEIEQAARWAREKVIAGMPRVGIIVRDLDQRRDEVLRTFEDIFAPGERASGRRASAVRVLSRTCGCARSNANGGIGSSSSAGQA